MSPVCGLLRDVRRARGARAPPGYVLPSDSLAAKLDAAEPDDLVTDGGVDRRRRIAIRGNPVWMDTPAGYEEWIDSLPSTFDLDDGFTETARGGAKFVMLDPKRDPLDRPLTDHRRGLCFDVESTEMREACHEAIAEHLDTEPAVHEVRHQKSECHTDLVYCELDADGVAARREMTTGTAPLHDPLQRFKVWWYVNEYGPKGRQEVVTNGKYANDATNRTRQVAARTRLPRDDGDGHGYGSGATLDRDVPRRRTETPRLGDSARTGGASAAVRR